MRRDATRILGLLLLASGSLPATALAQDAGAPTPPPDGGEVVAPPPDVVPAPPPPASAPPGQALAAAEEAYVNIDFESVRDLATQALNEGGHTPTELVRIYKLLGMAHAALGELEPANRAFVRMLMLAPDEEVTELSPQLRAPYLEARGRLSALSGRFETTVSLARPTSSVVVRLSDPTRMAARIVISARVAGRGRFQTREWEPEERITWRLPGLTDAGWAEYSLDVLDEHGNHLQAVGTLEEPATLGEPIVVQRIADESTVFESPWFWTVVGVVLVGSGVGIYAATADPSLDGQSGVCFNCP